MPSKSDNICSHPGCNRLTTATYCDDHSDITKLRHKEHKQERTDNQEQSFYQSKPWKSIRQAVLQRDFYLCQSCKRQGITKVGNIVHHIVELKDDWDLRLEMSNLETICSACHNKEHNSNNKKALNTSSKNVIIVVLGYPGSGKSTFVDNNMDKERDIVIDLDKFVVAMTDRPLHNRQLNAFDSVAIANDMIDSTIDNLTLNKYKFKRVWIIRSSLTASQGSKLNTVGARFVNIERDKNVCIRLAEDKGRGINQNVFLQIDHRMKNLKERVEVESKTAYDKI